MQIRDRIKDLRRVRAGDLRPHPKNWRTHPEEQQNALRGILAEVGYVDALIVRELADGSLQIVDGHLRADPPSELGSIDGRQFKSARRAYYLYFYDRSQYLTKRGSPTTVQYEGRTYALRYVRSVERIPYAGDVWNLTVEGHPSFQTSVGLSHNTEKPVELAARAMQYSSRPGENVLDLFGGSGSTLMAAEQTGRKAFLMELDPPYCDVICERFEKFTGKKVERLR